MAPIQADAPESNSGRCARCFEIATRKCDGCLRAPPYDQGPVQSVFYCSTNCQKADWGRHREECKALQARKSLRRAGMVLQAALCRIRRNAYPLAVTSVQHEAEMITLISPSPLEDKSVQRRLQPFATELEDDRSLLEAILTHASGVESMIYLHSIAKELFAGLWSRIEEVDLLPKYRKLRIRTGIDTATHPGPQEYSHQVYKVMMNKKEEVWAVDVAGAQFGYPDALCPWSDYSRERCGQVNGWWEFGFVRNQATDSDLCGPLQQSQSAKMTDVRALAEVLERQIPQWAAAGHGGKLNAMLKGPEAKFQAAKERFLDQVEAHVWFSLANMYHPDGTLRLTAEIHNASGSITSLNQDPAEAGATASKLYCIRAVQGKGQGMFATSKIPKGTRILSEAPIFRFPRVGISLKALEHVIAREVGLLNRGQREAFFSLLNIHGSLHSPALGIARTNALPLGPDASEGGIFPETSRINHSCRHNAQNMWNTNLQLVTVHACRDIEEGEELTISYLGTLDNHATRQSRLKDSFRFVCACELCSLPEAQRRQSDQRLDKINLLDVRIGDGQRIVNKPLECLHDAHEVIRLLTEEGTSFVDPRIPRLYYDAFQIAIANGDQARARVFAQRAYAARVTLEGYDSPDAIVLKEYVKRPADHRLYGMTMKWKQDVTKVQRVTGLEFENWLWRCKMVSLGSS